MDPPHEGDTDPIGVDEELDADDRALLRSIGHRLRQARHRRGWSLATVAERSDGHLKASAVANYERGERAPSAARLARLAALYRVTPAELIGQEVGITPLIDLTRRGAQAAGGTVPLPRLVIDANALEGASRSRDLEIVFNLVRSLRAQRADPGPVFSLRAADVAHLARALARTPASIAAELAGVVVDFVE
ncbi:MAG TPA: helix-turn-helix transcriptional regulator [Acidimicrobiales bacterium]|nr:helix-turn-helix transcriptional regulator [Acidimicrobiales bacterium]